MALKLSVEKGPEWGGLSLHVIVGPHIDNNNT